MAHLFSASVRAQPSCYRDRRPADPSILIFRIGFIHGESYGSTLRSQRSSLVCQSQIKRLSKWRIIWWAPHLQHSDFLITCCSLSVRVDRSVPHPGAVRDRSRRREEAPTRCHGTRTYLWAGRAGRGGYYSVRIYQPVDLKSFTPTLELYSLGATSCYVTEWVKSSRSGKSILIDHMKQCGPHLYPSSSDVPPPLTVHLNIPSLIVRSAIPCTANSRIHPLPACTANHRRQEGHVVDSGAVLSNSCLSTTKVAIRIYCGTWEISSEPEMISGFEVLRVQLVHKPASSPYLMATTKRFGIYKHNISRKI